MTKKDLYGLLNVDKKATDDDIKKAYRTLAKQWHPDKNSAPNAEERFKEIGNAYETLKDPSKRRTYDLQTSVDDDRPKNESRTSRQGGTNASYSSSSKPKASYTFFKDDTTDQNKNNFSKKFSFTSPRFKYKSSTFTSFPDIDDSSDEDDYGFPKKKSTGYEQSTWNRKSKSKSSRSFSFSERPEWNNSWHENPPFDSKSTDFFDFPDMFNDEAFKSEFENIDTLFSEIFDLPFKSSFFKNKPGRRRYGSSNTMPDYDPMGDDIWNWKKPMFDFRKPSMVEEDDFLDFESIYCPYCDNALRLRTARLHILQCSKGSTFDSGGFDGPSKTKKAQDYARNIRRPTMPKQSFKSSKGTGRTGSPFENTPNGSNYSTPRQGYYGRNTSRRSSSFQ